MHAKICSRFSRSSSPPECEVCTFKHRVRDLETSQTDRPFSCTFGFFTSREIKTRFFFIFVFSLSFCEQISSIKSFCSQSEVEELDLKRKSTSKNTSKFSSSYDSKSEVWTVLEMIIRTFHYFVPFYRKNNQRK